jgi:hypothetical protein
MRRITRSARIVRAATVAVVLTVGAALSGCTVAVEGTPRPAAEPASQSVTDRPFPPRGDSGAPRSVAAEFDGQLVDHERVVVLDGRPAEDSVIDVRSPSGTPTRQLLRWIEFPDHVVLVQAIGDRADSAKLEQVRDIVTSTVRVP